uniref:Uncharacterized protein n=1 Tax=Anguilla anguilla TaxID=7936 RepID=A0A0E9XAZ2_ANGAN
MKRASKGHLLLLLLCRLNFRWNLIAESFK